MTAAADADETEVQTPVPSAGGDPTEPGGSDGEASVADEGGSGDPAVRTAAEHLAQDSVEEVIGLLERTTIERDEYLDTLRRNQADFENYRKRAAKQVADDAARAVEGLVEKLLPVLDACDAAVHHGATEVEPVYAALLGALEKEGLVRVAPHDEAFDPNVHEAVMHEPADDDQEGTVVSDVMRPGYLWKGRVVRPAMVKVKG